MNIVVNSHSQTMKLGRMTQINEEIKKVTLLSFEVNLVALNAMLVTKRAGERSRGFGVVSSELRKFSSKLREAMGNLGVRIFGLINDVASMQKLIHQMALLQRVSGENGEIHKFMRSPIVNKEKLLVELRQSMEEEQDRLLLQVRRTLKLCDMGTALVRCAKIESVYGGNMSGSLKQVASQIEGTIEEILGILTALESRLVTHENT